LVWATGQYLAFAKPGEVLAIDVTIAVDGHQTTQARAVGSVGDREIITVNAALGERPGMPGGQFEVIPDVDPPARHREHFHRRAGNGWINDQLEQRLVKGRDVADRDGTLGDGQSLMWARIPDVIEGIDAAGLAILGDFVPMGIGMSLGIEGGGTSLDNTLRVVRLVPTDWVLLDIRVHGADRGFGHGLVHMFAEDGTLLATASQSCVVRYWK
jgi:acyl-CoA thioesterase